MAKARTNAGALILLMALCGVWAHGQTEPYRPQVHFSPRTNWTNDPNGLVYFQGEYHLFFQHNPFGDEWGHMSWGHAVSTDLLHWNELPVAIPEKDGIMIFTGSVVVDRTNSSGFCGTGKECLVAVYTGDEKSPHRETQNLAYSLDRGRTWTKYEKNPVLDLHMADFRDPGVFWDESTRQWVMAVALPKEFKVRLYSSHNLKDWTQLSDFGPAGDVAGVWECPNLLRIPSENGKEPMWAMKVGLNPGAPQGGSGEQYFFGSFDGKRFKASTEAGAHGWTDYGKDDYCAISYNGLPAGEKPVLLGWMSNWQYAAKSPTSPWRGQMTLPRRLSYVRDAAGLSFKQEPVIAPLRQSSFPLAWPGSGKPVRAPYELQIAFAKPEKPIFGVRLYSDEQHWTEIGFDTTRKEFYVDRTQSGKTISADFPARTTAPLADGRPYDLHLVVDVSSVEAYAQNGTITMTNLIFPMSTSSTIRFFPQDAKPRDFSAQGWELSSIWSLAPQ
jgi:fructan beta-fructosidase